MLFAHNDIDYTISLFPTKLIIQCRDCIDFNDIHKALQRWGEENADVLRAIYPTDMECIEHEGQSLFGFGSPHIHECGWKVKYEFDTDTTSITIENMEKLCRR